jgi:putative transposase
MPRSLRIEYEGAIYHILNRGNYRQGVFAADASKEAFLSTLWAACDRCGWILHAYCLMDNHYHLALETPEPNLSVGMQWLQATFANRFNRQVRQRGHVFQGRFKALVVERDEYLGPLIHYIHLNPVRAGIVPVEGLTDWRWSSLWYLFRKGKRPACLRQDTGLYYAGHLTDSGAGRRAYVAYLDWLVQSDKARKEMKFEKLCRGWALGTREFKKELVETSGVSQGLQHGGRESVEARQLYWERLLDKMLAYHHKGKADVAAEKKSAVWKVMIAHYLKRHTAASNGWLSTHLHMGACQAISRYIAQFERSGGPSQKAYRRMIASVPN